MEVRVFRCPYRDNLCDTCTQHIVECTGDNIEFGSAVGGDNVVQCDSYTPREVLPEGIVRGTIDVYEA